MEQPNFSDELKRDAAAEITGRGYGIQRMLWMAVNQAYSIGGPYNSA